MSSRRSVRKVLVAVLVGVLVGGGLMAVTPAGAEVSSALATNWKKIWKKEIRPRADKRYYTKKQSDGKYQPKGDYALNGSSYTKAETYSKAEADAKYQPKGNYALNGSSYTKAESDAKYAPTPTVIRGSWSLMDNAPAVGSYLSTDLNWGYTFTGALTVHFIPPAGAPPAGCSGNAAAPSADAGHLCVFAFGSNGVGTIDIRNVTNNAGTTSAFGANLFATSTAAGNVYAYGSWAARGTGLAAGAPRPSAEDGSRSTVPGQ